MNAPIVPAEADQLDWYAAERFQEPESHRRAASHACWLLNYTGYWNPKELSKKCKQSFKWAVPFNVLLKPKTALAAMNLLFFCLTGSPETTQVQEEWKIKNIMLKNIWADNNTPQKREHRQFESKQVDYEVLSINGSVFLFPQSTCRERETRKGSKIFQGRHPKTFPME